MNKYQVYLTTNETIFIEADGFRMYFDVGAVRFYKGDCDNVIAVFVLSNICGFEKVDEFDDEEDNNGQQ